MYRLLLAQATLPGEGIASKALDADPLTLALFLAALIALAMVVGAVTGFFAIRVIGQRAASENKTMTTIATTMGTALAEALDTRDSQVAKEIRDIETRDAQRKEAQTQLLVNQAKAMEMVVSKLEALPSILEILSEIVRSVEVLKLHADKDRESLGLIVGQNTTLDDLVQSFRSELAVLTAMLKETTGNIEDIQAAMTAIATMVKQVTEMNEIVHYLKKKADTTEMPAVKLPLAHDATEVPAQ